METRFNNLCSELMEIFTKQNICKQQFCYVLVNNVSELSHCNLNPAIIHIK